METTLNRIRYFQPCCGGWVKLLSHLGKTKADDEPLHILTILRSNDLDDTLWCLRAVEGHDSEIRLFAVKCARRIQDLMKDPRSLNAVDIAERFANGNATKEELREAELSTRAAVGDTSILAENAYKNFEDLDLDYISSYHDIDLVKSRASLYTKYFSARASNLATRVSSYITAGAITRSVRIAASTAAQAVSDDSNYISIYESAREAQKKDFLKMIS